MGREPGQGTEVGQTSGKRGKKRASVRWQEFQFRVSPNQVDEETRQSKMSQITKKRLPSHEVGVQKDEKLPDSPHGFCSSSRPQELKETEPATPRCYLNRPGRWKEGG